jgi:hypothetical protein
MPLLLRILAPADFSAGAVAVICAALTGVLLVAVRPRIAATTLVGPWVWCLVSLAALGSVEAAFTLEMVDDALAVPLRFAAAVGVFSPWMSLLGAKRPQDTAWHFIVASLWGIQAMPAAEALWLRPGQPMAIIDFRYYLLLGLVALSLLVYLPTRFWLSAFIAAVGQFLLASSFQPWASQRATAYGIVCLCVAAYVALITARRRHQASGFDRLWLDFRDRFGALWAARVLERINAEAAQRRAPLRLGWSGFYDSATGQPLDEIPPQLRPELRQSFVNLLRRFVSAESIDATLGE